MANKPPRQDAEPARPGQGFLMVLIASGLGAAITVGAMQWMDGRTSPDVQQEILAELKNISAALQGGPRPAPAVQGQVTAPQQPRDLRIAIDNSASLGRPDAKLVMVEFSDFDCPYCARYSENTKEQFIREYVQSGKVRYVFRNMPLARLHPRAQREAEAAECARQQNKFWEIYPRLFTNKQPFTDAELRDQAVAAGVTASAFDSCFPDQATAKVMKDLDDGGRAGIAGTPMFFFGSLDESGRLKVEGQVIGAEPIAKFRAVVDPLLASR